jgi:hypothetical protein
MNMVGENAFGQVSPTNPEVSVEAGARPVRRNGRSALTIPDDALVAVRDRTGAIRTTPNTIRARCACNASRAYMRRPIVKGGTVPALDARPRVTL